MGALSDALKPMFDLRQHTAAVNDRLSALETADLHNRVARIEQEIADVAALVAADAAPAQTSPSAPAAMPPSSPADAPPSLPVDAPPTTPAASPVPPDDPASPAAPARSAPADAGRVKPVLGA